MHHDITQKNDHHLCGDSKWTHRPLGRRTKSCKAFKRTSLMPPRLMQGG